MLESVQNNPKNLIYLLILCKKKQICFHIIDVVKLLFIGHHFQLIQVLWYIKTEIQMIYKLHIPFSF